MITTSVSSNNAVLLLGAAAELGLDKGVVRQVRGRFTAPDEVFKEAGFTVDKDSATATAPDTADSKPAKRTAKKTVAAKKTAAAKAAEGE